MSDYESGPVIATLADGLILRRANWADQESLAAFHGLVHADDDGTPDANITIWVRELMSGSHPTFSASDFTIIETPTGEIVSSLCLISQVWTYAGIPIKAGRVELVSTRKDYRRRGLVRRQMDIAHAWSAERGELIQGISGIPNFYRQFGYEMALDLGGGRYLNSSRAPEPGKDETEAFVLRTAIANDAAFIAELQEAGRKRWLLTAIRDADHWRYEIEPKADPKYAVGVVVIETADGTPIGYLVHYGDLTDGYMVTIECELVAGTSWLAVMPSLLRGLIARGETLATQYESGPLREVYFGLGSDHPLYQVLPARHTNAAPAYSWFVRIPDIPEFLRLVAPVLEERLASSVACGYTGELLLNFYTNGLRLVFEQGRLSTIDTWAPEDTHSGGATFHDLTVLQLIVGYRSLAELRHAFTDCRINDDTARILLEILFPKRPSNVWAID